MHESAVRADMQQYYGIDIDHAMSGGHTPHHVACLLVELPPNARTRIASDADALWTLNDVIMAGVYNSLNALMYGMSDHRKRGAPPKPLGPAWLARKGRKTLPARAMPASELMEILNRPRG